MKEKFNIITLLSILILATLFSNACKKPDKADQPEPVYPKNVLVEYKVSGTGVSKVTSLIYTNSTGGTTNLSDLTIPFSVSFNRSVNIGNDLRLSVFHNNSVTGNPFNVKLEIYVDNKLVKSETYDGTNNITGAIVHFF